MNRIRTQRKVTIKTGYVEYDYLSEKWDDLNEVCVESFASWEPRSRALFSALAGNANVVLDVGAYTGVYSLECAVKYPLLRVIASEPNPRTLAALRHNIALNSVENHIEVHDLGLGLRTYRARLNVDDSDFGSSTASLIKSEKLSSSLDINVVPLDKLLRGVHVDLMKVDIEGGEISFLIGARKTIRRSHPVIVMEALRHREYLKQRLILFFLGYGRPERVGIDRGDQRNFVWSAGPSRAIVSHTLAKLAFNHS